MFQKSGTNLKNTNMQKVLTKLHLVPIGRIWFWISKGLLKGFRGWRYAPVYQTSGTRRNTGSGIASARVCQGAAFTDATTSFCSWLCDPVTKVAMSATADVAWKHGCLKDGKTALQEVKAEIAHEHDAQRQLEEKARQLEDHPALRFPVFLY